ncbi:MAG: hypothetical protein LLG04_13810 [Parachlamydia sp.]|nr:hypothetical protein [Parachlamydia sp.]
MTVTAISVVDLNQFDLNAKAIKRAGGKTTAKAIDVSADKESHSVIFT